MSPVESTPLPRALGSPHCKTQTALLLLLFPLSLLLLLGWQSYFLRTEEILSQSIEFLRAKHSLSSPQQGHSARESRVQGG